MNRTKLAFVLFLATIVSGQYQCNKEVRQLTYDGSPGQFADEPLYWLTPDNNDVVRTSENPNDVFDELPNRLLDVTIGIASMDYHDNNVFKGVTAMYITTIPKSIFDPLKMPRNFHKSVGIQWIEH